MFHEGISFGGEVPVSPKRVRESMIAPEERAGLSLDRQWDTPDQLVFRKGKNHQEQVVEVFDMVPSLKSLEETPVMVVPGFTEGPATLEENIRGLASAGLRTLTYDAPSGIGLEYFDPKKITPGQFADYEVNKAGTLLKVMEKKGIERTDAVAHSEGCVHLVLAALEQPDRFRNIVLVNPGGMVGADNLMALVRRAYGHWVAERRMAESGQYAPGSIERAQAERNRNFVESMKRGLPSARAIVCAEIHEILRTLKQLGIGISIIHSVDDVLFPMDRVQETTSGDEVDGFYSVRGGHNDFFLNPEDWTLLVNEALSALDRKYPAEPSHAPGTTLH